MERSRTPMRSACAGIVVVGLLVAVSGCAERMQKTSEPLGIGRPATAAELAKFEPFSVRPDGRGLPPGRGTAVEGRGVYAAKCAACHGATGREGGTFGPRWVPALVDSRPFKAAGPGPVPATVGNYWPYATTIWDYTHRSMPFDHPGTLTFDEVYAVTAYLLNANGLIGEGDVVDARTLPRVKMPNQGNFVPDPRPDIR